MSVQIVSRRRVPMAQSTPDCKACGFPIKFVEPIYIVTVRVDGRTHTPRICETCNKHKDERLLMELSADARRVSERESVFLTDYVKQMAAQK